MKGLRSTLVMLALFLALGSYAYFIESERPPASEADAAEPAFEIEADAIMSLTVTADNGDVTDVSRSAPGDATWTVDAPFTAGADGNAASAIADSLASLEIRRVVEEEASDFSRFGLAEPVFAVEFGTDDGTETLVVGDETPTGSDRYATVRGTTRVFLIAGFLESTFNRTSFDLRDRSLLEFTGPEVSGLLIEQEAATIRFDKAEGTWSLAEPVDARADFGLVEGLVGRIGSAEMVAVERESVDPAAAEGLEPFGLDEPRLTVTVEAGDDDQVLLVGADSPAGTVYGRDAARALVYTLDAALVDDLVRSADTYRQPDLFDFRPFNASSLALTRDGATSRFEKTAAGDDDAGGEVWRQTEPEERAVEPATADDLLSTLSSLRAESFVDSRDGTGLEAPLATVTVTFGDDDREETVVIGRAGEQTYAAHGNEPGAAVVDGTAVDEALAALEAAIDPSAADPAP